MADMREDVIQYLTAANPREFVSVLSDVFTDAAAASPEQESANTMQSLLKRVARGETGR